MSTVLFTDDLNGSSPEYLASYLIHLAKKKESEVRELLEIWLATDARLCHPELQDKHFFLEFQKKVLEQTPDHEERIQKVFSDHIVSKASKPKVLKKHPQFFESNTSAGVQKMARSKKTSKHVAKKIERLIYRMTSLFHRKEERYDCKDGKASYYQTFGCLAKDKTHSLKFVRGKAFGSAVQTVEHTQQLANLGSLVYQSDKGPQGNKKVVCTRSARSDCPLKIYEKSWFDLETRLDSKDFSCFKPVQGQENTYTYRRVDKTAMDQNPYKSLVTGLASWAQGKRIEKERSFYEHKLKAAHDLFQLEEGKKGCEKTLEGGVKVVLQRDEEGQVYLKHQIGEVEIREYKPFVCNVVHSKSYLLQDNVKVARASNREFYDMCLSQLGIDGTCADGKGQAELEKKMRALPEKKGAEWIKLKALYFGITGQEFDAKISLSYTHQAFLETYYINVLAQSQGFALSSECKSGIDRTASEIAIEFARQELVKKYGDSVDVSDPKGAHFEEFRVWYGKGLCAFAIETARVNRGHDRLILPKLKVKSHDLFNYLILPQDYRTLETFVSL